MRDKKFKIQIRRKDGTDLQEPIIVSLKELILRNGCLFNSNLYEVVYCWEGTGVEDKNGKEIFENDKVVHFNFPEQIESVYWNEKEACFACRGGECESWLTSGYEIIGE